MGDGWTRYDASGADDEATGVFYGVLVWAGSPHEEYSDNLNNKFLFKSNGCECILPRGELLPYSEYIVLRSNMHVSGRFSAGYGNREEFNAVLSRRGVTLSARNDILRLVYDNPVWTATEAGVVGLNVRLETYAAIPYRISSRAEDHQNENEGGEEEEEEEGEVVEEEQEVEEEEEDENEDRPITHEAYMALEYYTITADGQEREPSCAICLEEMSVGCEVTKLPCSHVFHQRCILQWLFGHCYCPLCRFKLPSIYKGYRYCDCPTGERCMYCWFLD